MRRGLFWDVAGQGHIAWIRTLAPTRAVGPWGDDVSPPSFWAFRFLTTKRVTWQLSTALTSCPVPSPPHFSNHSEQSEPWGVCLEQPPSLPPSLPHGLLRHSPAALYKAAPSLRPDGSALSPPFNTRSYVLSAVSRPSVWSFRRVCDRKPPQEREPCPFRSALYSQSRA